MTSLAAAVGGIYYFWKRKSESDSEADNFDDLDDFDDLEDVDDMDEEEESADSAYEATDTVEDERGYVTLKMHNKEQESVAEAETEAAKTELESAAEAETAKTEQKSAVEAEAIAAETTEEAVEDPAE